MVRFRAKVIILACAVALAWGAVASAQLVSAPRRVMISGNTYHVATCAGPARIGYARCFAHVVTDRTGSPLMNRMVTNRFETQIRANVVPEGWGPRALNLAYNPAVTPKYPAGVGSQATIVAIVDAFGYPNAEADLGVYRSEFGLPACTTANGCFQKINQWGGTPTATYPKPDAGWADETALDLDMVSAMCPHCKILLVEAVSTSSADLATAVNTAVKKGAHVVSNSYGGPEYAGAPNAAYNHPGVAITVSTGDNAYDDSANETGPYTANFPASSQYVTAVGGTGLYFYQQVGFLQDVWANAGSGCSKIFPKPAWQKDKLCTMRMEADVSAVADPETGVAIYGPCGATCAASAQFTPGWAQYGGTSVAAPLVGGIYGANGGTVTAGSVYASTTRLSDVVPFAASSGFNNTNGNDTSGSPGDCFSTYFCNARVGYDGPTGLGTPTGEAGF